VSLGAQSLISLKSEALHCFPSQAVWWSK